MGLILLLIALDLPGCNAHGPQPRDDAKKSAVAVIQSKSATFKHSYKCRIDSPRYVQVDSPVGGRLAAILVKEGQAVKRGEVLFQVGPPTGKEKPGAENTDKVVSVKAPCDGPVGGFSTLRARVRTGTSLAAVSDDSAMRVRFDMPEGRYLAFMTERGEDWRNTDVELILADHSKYPHAGKIVDILGSFGNPNGDISFLAEFPNPDGLLRPGQTGRLLMNLVLKAAILIPQRATFEDHAQRYVCVVDKDHVAHRRKIVIQDETEELFVIKKGVRVGDKIVIEGVGQVREGEKVE